MGVFISDTESNIVNDFGKHILCRYRNDEQLRKHFKHPIMFYDTDMIDTKELKRLCRIVNIYKHDSVDRKFNIERATEVLKGGLSSHRNAFNVLAQNIRFRLAKDGPIYQLPLIPFIFNYIMMVSRRELGIPLTSDIIWNPLTISNSDLIAQFDRIIYNSSIAGKSFTRICDELEEIKFYFNIICYECGDRLMLSISNNEFVEVAARSKEAYESMSCSFRYPENATPRDIETIRSKKTAELLDIIAEQEDLSISTYVKNGLFNRGQFSEYAVQQGLKPDLQGNTIPITGMTNVMMGINDIQSYFVDAKGGRKAEVAKDVVSDVVSFERNLTTSAEGIRTVDTNDSHSCGSMHFRIREIESLNDFCNLDGRVFATEDPNLVPDTPFWEADADFLKPYGISDIEKVDPDRAKNAQEVLDVMKSCVGKKIWMKTPITCSHPLRHRNGTICAACYGRKIARMNANVNIGKLAAFRAAYQFAQTQLSAKHQLTTNSVEPVYPENFEKYFTIKGFNEFVFNDAIIKSRKDLGEIPEQLKNLYFMFDEVEKIKSTNGTPFSRKLNTIKIYDDSVGKVVDEISFHGVINLFMSEEMESEYIDIRQKSCEDSVLIPFSDMMDDIMYTTPLFAFEFVNNEMAKPIKEIMSILETSKISKISSFNECLDILLPLFRKGKLDIPETHIEILIASLIRDVDNKRKMIDWSKNGDIEYQMVSIETAALNSNSVVTSLQFSHVSKQLSEGAYGTFEKTATSCFDNFL